MRILLIEDDRMIGEALAVALRDAAYAVDWVQDGDAAEVAIAHGEHQAVLLDLGLPKQSGLCVLRRLRAAGHTLPVIIVTCRDDIDDRIEGLDHGADDYLIKPFDVKELLARLRAVIRRRGGRGAPVLSNGIVSLNPATREAECANRRHNLTTREFALLHALLQRPGMVLSRHDLEEQLYGWNEAVASNAVDFLIHGLRSKLGAGVIANIRGAGWRVAEGP